MNFFPIDRATINFDQLDQYFRKCSKNILDLDITIAQRDQVVKLCIQMLSEVNNCCKSSLNDPEMKKVCEDVHVHATNHLRSIDSRFKREKIMKKSKLYVAPLAMSSGFEFVTKIDDNSGQPIRTTVQRTFQYVSIIKTLTALFGDEEFEQMYVTFNASGDHQCQEGVYKRFCCGNVFQKSVFFKTNPMAIQIKLFTDDVEPCSALKSKAGIHKISAFYLQINNLPQQFLSKVNSIYLVALCDSSDSKNEYTNADNVMEIIVKDIQELETKGIETISGLNLKAALICGMYDNLGGNIMLGLYASFNSNNYCRICIASKQVCQIMTKEDPDLVRTQESYKECIAALESSSKIKKTNGIKNYCCLNDLNQFHIMENITVDFMHDILEGLIGFTLENIFKMCATTKIASMDQIQGLIDCFYFGELSKSNKPSKINLEKKNIGQNASQAYCLFTSLPFILFKYRQKLHKIWSPVESLLQILQIVSSASVNESDVKRLEILVQSYLEDYKKIFNENLRPKHHFLLHYARVIRSMGPVIWFWVMRMESKHQFFKRVAQKTKNYINLKKTMAEQHQEKVYFAGFVYKDEIVVGKRVIPMESLREYKKYEDTISQVFTMTMIEEASIVNSLQINSIKYKSNYLLVCDNAFCEIEHIVMHENRFWFICSLSYNIKKVDTFLNSFLLEKIEQFQMISLSELKNINVYEKKNLNCETYVTVENLDVYYLCK